MKLNRGKLGFVVGGAIGMFFSGMRYDAPGAFAIPGGGGTAAFNNLKWYKQLYLGIKDMGTTGLRQGKVISNPAPFQKRGLIL